MGMPCDLRRILDIARHHSLPVIEDAACAAGSEILWNGQWEKIGKPHGSVACFSFHPRKLLTTGDGGMLTTANPEWDKKFRLWRQHSMDVPDTVRHASNRVIFESYPELGYNYRLTDIQAAIGREQLKRLPEVIKQRRLLGERYLQLLAEVPGLGLPEEPDWARTNWQSFCVRLPEECEQQAVMQKMLAAGVATRRGIMCAHREQAYLHEPWLCPPSRNGHESSSASCSGLIESEKAQDHSIILPMFHDMSPADQDKVVSVLRRACAGEI